ncbi:PAS domain S-box protein [Methanocella sp. MCL-LM]|uniref:PAS domain S-box protein n=1 Tax=Methanocella sp. MCL-LM TaxID=3412035 RepID=UPI003C715799
MTDTRYRREGEHSDEFYRLVFENVRDPVLVIRPDGRIIVANDAIVAAIGYSKEELLRMNISDLRPDFEKPKIGEHLEKSRQGATYETVYKRKDGSLFPVEISTKAAVIEGEMTFLGIIRDITERKRVEERLDLTQFAVDHFTDSSIWLDPNGQIIYVNDATCRSTGYDRSELLAMHIWDLDPEFSPEVFAQNWSKWEETSGRRVQNRFESVHRTKSGKVFPVEITGNIFAFKGRKYFVTYDRDITERRQTEEALTSAKARAELYVDLMSHDINNLNHSAMGYLEMALDELEVHERLERDNKVLIEKPLQAIKNSSALIENVRKLQMLMIESVKTRPIDLHDLLSEMDTGSFHEVDRDITVNIPDIPDYKVEANELLKDVFTNLISNSIKHSDRDKPLTVNVLVEPASENHKKYYRCSIEDNGPGIPDDLKGRLFRKFQRGATRAQGKGLGLYLVRTLVDGFKGKVWVEDRVPGDHTQGARFVVILPAAEAVVNMQ